VTLLGAIEGGGTKLVCALAEDRAIVDEKRIVTTTPRETLDAAIAFFSQNKPDAIGVGMFGPLDVARGVTLRTPKPGWDAVPVRARLADALGVPVVVDTDVNAAALAEHRFGAARNADPALYVTVGTGVGGGVIVAGRPLHGLLHPEFGHVFVPRLPLADGAPDAFDGACPFHGRCLEGLVSGPALARRVGQSPEALADDDPVFELAGRYLGYGLAQAVLVLSPERIVVGGGVAARTALLPAARTALREALAGYVPREQLLGGIDGYIVPPALGQRAGLAGAIELAVDALGGV
jgi:fructokinase